MNGTYLPRLSEFTGAAETTLVLWRGLRVNSIDGPELNWIHVSCYGAPR
jgi:hypothetical protein